MFPTTDLDMQLKVKGIKTLIVSGLMTHACVSGVACDEIGVNHVAPNLRFNQREIESTLQTLADDVLPDFAH